MLTKQWIEVQIALLLAETDRATRRAEAAAEALNRARREYDEAVEGAKTVLGCARGLGEELAFMENRAVRNAGACEGICPPRS